jgi:sugar-specific transcriptional regulator TrmB
MELSTSLKNLGLSSKEASIYLALLELGKASAYVVAKKADLKKPTTYVILDGLIEKGFVSRVPRARKQLYVAEHPNELIRSYREKLNKVEGIIPQLLAIAQKDSKSVKTIFLEGYEGMRKALWYRLDELDNSEFVGFYASADGVDKKLMDLIDEFNSAIFKKQITIRGIVPSHRSLKRFRKGDKENRRNMKIVPYSTYSASTSIDVSESFVRILMYKELQAIIIDNPNVAKTVKQIFEMIWNSH